MADVPQNHQEIIDLIREETQAHLDNDVSAAALGLALSFVATEMSLQLAPTHLMAVHNVNHGQMLALADAFESYKEEMEEQLSLPLIDNEAEEDELPSDAIIH